MVVYQVISLGFDMDKAAAEVEALEKEKVEKEAREEEKRRCSHSPSDLLFLACLSFTQAQLTILLKGAQPTSSNEGAGRMENDIQARTEPPRRRKYG